MTPKTKTRKAANGGPGLTRLRKSPKAFIFR
jgi:hypothetical protein